MKVTRQQQLIGYILIIMLAVVSFGLVFYSQTKEVKVPEMNTLVLKNSIKETNVLDTNSMKWNELDKVKDLRSDKEPEIDLTLRPISELIEMDFATLDVSKKDATIKCKAEILVEDWETSFNPFESNGWVGELVAKDNCLVEYSNQYLKFSFSADYLDSVALHSPTPKYYNSEDRDLFLMVGRVPYSRKSVSKEGDFENRIKMHISRIIEGYSSADCKSINIKTFINEKGTLIFRCEAQCEAGNKKASKAYMVGVNFNYAFSMGTEGQAKREEVEILTSFELINKENY